MENTNSKIVTSTYTLRPYQSDLISQIESAWQSRRRIMLQLATGGGKTVIFAHITREFAKRGIGVMVLAHREELLFQAKEKLEAITEIPVGIIKSGYPVHPYDLQVASVQSLVRRKEKPDVGLIIVDEAHHAAAKTYTSIMKEYPTAYILGCTATPHRIDGQGFKWLFDTLICGPSTRELIQQQHLSPYKLFQAVKIINPSSVKITGGDYNGAELAEIIDDQIEPIDVVNEWLDRANKLRTVVFAVDIAHSRSYADAFLEAGIIAEHLDGYTPKDERRNILQRFSTGETTIICNCGIISEGFDLQAIECVQVVRPTKSLTMWLQMVGRGLRFFPGKKYATIIDHTKNWDLLGLPDEDRQWTLEPISIDEEAKRYLHIVCTSCNHAFKPLSHELKVLKCECPNCRELHAFGIGEGGIDLNARGDLKAVTTELKVDLEVDIELKSFIDTTHEECISKGRKIGWVFYSFKEHCEDFLPSVSLGTWRYLADKLGYKTGWAWIKWKEVQEEV